MLEHMILSHHYEPEFEALRSHCSQEADAALPGHCRCEDVRYGEVPREFQTVACDRVWPLDNRRLYKRTF